MTGAGALAAAEPPGRPAAQLDDVPGDYGLPVIGNTFKEVFNPLGHMGDMHRKYGRIFRTDSFFFKKVVAIGPEAAEQVIFNRDGAFSCAAGWKFFMSRLMENNLLLMDGSVHAEHRRLLQVSVHPEALRRYFATLQEGYAGAITAWGAQGELLFFPALKQATLEQATKVFYGMGDAVETQELNKATSDMTQAMSAVLRVAIPGTKFWRGRRGAAKLEEILFAEIPKRRTSDGADILSVLCSAKEDGAYILTDRQIVDHLKPFWMAAHDTITSSVTSMTYELAQHPDWQEKVREEIFAVCGDRPLAYEDLSRLEVTEAVYNEGMRLHTPVPSLPRVAERDFEVEGVTIPAGTLVIPLLFYSHLMPEYWPDPEQFDPGRFLGGRRSRPNRPRMAFAPFGGGAHTCLGLRFAYMTMKVIMADMLRRFRISRDRSGGEAFYPLPICRPKSGLPIMLEPL